MLLLNVVWYLAILVILYCATCYFIEEIKAINEKEKVMEYLKNELEKG
jgi:hypothetical protein